MKYIKLKAYSNGSVKVIQNDLQFYVDNDGTELLVDFSSADVSGLRKWVDFVMADGSETSRPILAEFTTENTLIISLDNTITKTGPLKIQPYANDPLTNQRVNFDVVRVVIGETLNVLSDSSFEDETALATALSNKIDLDGLNSNIDELHFDITPTSTDTLLEGQLRWNTLERTLDIGVDGNNVVLQVGQETHYPRTVNTGLTLIEDGDLVMYNGTTGGSGVINIKKYDPLAITLPGQVLGIATENISVNAQGKVTWFGLINGVPTSGSVVGETWTDGTILYNHPTLAGKMSSTKPQAPLPAIQVAIVVRPHESNGILFVRPIFFPMLWMLSDVSIGDGSDGDVLIWNDNSHRWENSDELSLPRWDDLFFPFSQSKLGTNLKPDYDYNNNGLLFPRNDTSEYVLITVQMPHEWKEGSDIEPHIHYIQNQNLQPVFNLEYRWTNIGDVESGSWTTISLNVNNLPYTSGNLHQVLSGASISGAGKTISSILDIKLYRNDNVYVGDLLAKQFDIHYQKDSFGSRQEYIK